jgi:hypothetical protein
MIVIRTYVRHVKDVFLRNAVLHTCSFTVKGPGLSETPRILTRGMNLAHRRPTGNDSSCATRPLMVTAGYRKKKNWFKPGMMMAESRGKHQSQRSHFNSGRETHPR